MSIRILIFMLVCCMCAAMAKAVDIEIDANNVSHQFAGFGAQIWSGDTRVESILSSLHMKYVRMKFGGAWTPPTDATQAQMDAYVATKYDGDNNIRTTYEITNRLGIKVIANLFEGPAAWLGSGNRLKSDNFDDIARMWGSIAYYMQNHNMPISYIEMFNEPEGDWNVYVPGADYNTVVKLLRQELDSRGLTSVQICGPGLAYLYNAPYWFDDLDTAGVAALGAWSTHAWDEGWGHTDALPSFLDSRYKDYFDASILTKDPCRSKPVIITEYATGVLTYNGVTFSSADAPDSNQFAERCYENTLTLLNDGANILSYWQAADHDWMSGGMSGMMRRQGLGSTLRPVYYAFLTLAPYIPDNAMVITKTWNDPLISAAGFIGNGQLALAFANSTADTVNRTVRITGVTSLAITSALAFVAGAVINKTSEVSFNYATGSMDISLPRESTLTVVAVVNECSATLAGDLNGDCKVTFSDYGKVAADWLKDNRNPEEGDVIEDFESYSDTNSLHTKWVPYDTATLTLNTTIAHSGGKSMKMDYNNANSPYYGKALHWLVGSGIGVDWTAYDTLTLWFKCTVSKEPLKVHIVNKYGTNILQVPYGTPQVGDWTRWDIDLSPIPANQKTQIGRVDIFFTASNYGSGTTYFDDITVYDKDALVCSDYPDGDVNQDCVVDFKDIKVLGENWLTCTLIEQADCW